MSLNFKPKMTFNMVVTPDEGEPTTYTLNINDKLENLVYINTAKEQVTVTGVLTGITVVRNRPMPYEQGHADMTLFNLSSYEMSKELHANEVPEFVVTTLKLKIESETPSLCSLYVPVSAIVSVGAVVPADSDDSEEETESVIDHVTEDADGETETPEVVEVSKS